MTTDLSEILQEPLFRVFRQRNANPQLIEGCESCHLVNSCGGGCAARAYLYSYHTSGGAKTMLSKDPYCPRDKAQGWQFPVNPELVTGERLVHMDYLCTWIGKPR